GLGRRLAHAARGGQRKPPLPQSFYGRVRSCGEARGKGGACSRRGVCQFPYSAIGFPQWGCRLKAAETRQRQRLETEAGKPFSFFLSPFTFFTFHLFPCTFRLRAGSPKA